MWSYRDEGAFHEKVTNTIADDIVRAIQPRQLTVEGDFFVRGGIGTIVTVRHEKKGKGARAAKKSAPAKNGAARRK
jgi:7-cyano-7-deazaguanine reductase